MGGAACGNIGDDKGVDPIFAFWSLNDGAPLPPTQAVG